MARRKTRDAILGRRRRSAKPNPRRPPRLRFVLPRSMRDLADDEVLADLRRVARTLRTPFLSMAMYAPLGLATPEGVVKRFGSWSGAVHQAGLEPMRCYRATRANLRWNLRLVWQRLGRPPTKAVMCRPLSRFSASAYATAFGSWRNALKQCAAWAARHPNAAAPTSWIVPPKRSPSGPSSPRRRRRPKAVSARTRYTVLERDGFRCRFCGRSPATSAGLILHVDHIKPAARGGGHGGRDLRNLQTLCRDCNLGKRDSKPPAPRSLAAAPLARERE